MKIIADSGSTKTAWALVREHSNEVLQFRTGGINPVLLTDEALSDLLATELRPELDRLSLAADGRVTEVYFYGAGCRPDQQERMQHHLAQAIGRGLSESNVHVASDLLGACRALCGRESGICCILGTGSASCYYDGSNIAAQTPSLGYVLGDEGSGTSIGRRLVADLLKGQFSPDLTQTLMTETGLSVAQAIERVYRQPWPNRWMASMAPKVHQHIDHPEVARMVADEFTRFVGRNLVAYGHPGEAVHFVGSIAYHFRTQLSEALTAHGFTLGRIEQSPLMALVTYHNETK